MARLEYDIPSLIRFNRRAGSAELEAPQTGIRINAAPTGYDGKRLQFELLITYTFSRSFLDSFHEENHAFSFSLEDSETARAEVARTIDPHKRYPPMPTPNFKGESPREAAPKSFTTSWMNIPLRVALARKGAYPTFFATVFLQEHVSNTLAWNLWDGSVTSYLHGRPSPVEFDDGDEGREDDGDDDDDDDDDDGGSPATTPGGAPAPGSGAGITLRAVPRAPVAPGQPDPGWWFEGTLTVTSAELAQGSADAWLRSLFMTITSQASQLSRVAHWLGDRVVFPGDMVAVGGDLHVMSFRFELGSMFNSRFAQGVYYVQASARHHRSAVVRLPHE